MSLASVPFKDFDLNHDFITKTLVYVIVIIINIITKLFYTVIYSAGYRLTPKFQSTSTLLYFECQTCHLLFALRSIAVEISSDMDKDRI